MINYSAKCDCGTVQFNCEDEPLFTQNCHCNKCREVAALSMREADKVGYGWTAAYLTSNFKITAGKDNLEKIVRNDSDLFLCKTCHCLIYGMSRDPNKQAGIGINANNFIFKNPKSESFKPVRHIWYVNRVIDFNDDLPKFKDSPKEQFGSGELYGTWI